MAAEKQGKGKRLQLVGEVVSTKMQKTIVVRVARRFPHPLYGKVVERHKKYHAHDEEEIAREGDIVRIEECRPLSRTKRWRLVEIIRRAAQVEAIPEEETEAAP